MVLRDRVKGLISFRNPGSIISEQYRSIRTNINFSSADYNHHTLIVTSPGYGEGKSTTVSNLAISVVQQGARVLVIDADLRKPTLHKTFNIENRMGFANILAEEVLIEDSIKQTEIDNLEIITSGQFSLNPADLLSSKNIDHVIELAKKRYDMVLFDSSPVLKVTDGRVLANKCEGTILVLCYGKTKFEEALEAKRLLELARARCIGVILNNK